MKLLDLLMGSEEAAIKWGIHPSTVKNMCKRGDIDARKIGKSWVMLKDTPNPMINR